MIENKSVRILAIAPLTRGLGYAVMESPQQLVACGNKAVLKNKNARAMVWVEKFINHYQPDVLVLPDVNAKDTRRAPRIKTLHQRIGALARAHKLRLRLISNTQVRTHLLGQAQGTKQLVAERLAAKFPAELASRLPPKRRPWMSEDPRMDIFDAVGLAVGFWPQGKQ